MEIVFNSENISINKQKQLCQWLEMQFEKLETKLEIKSLKMIIISDYFEREIMSYYSKYDIKESIDCTFKNIKVFNIKNSYNLEQYMIIDSNIIEGLYSNERAQGSFHCIHHGLCYVHNNFFEHEIFNKEFIEDYNLNKIQGIVSCDTRSIWSEYASARLSAISVDLNRNNLIDNLYFSYLMKLLVLCNKKINTFKSSENRSIEKFLSELHNEITEMLKTCAIIQGYLDGLKIEENVEIADMINNILEGTCLRKIWGEQWKNLKFLYSIYPNWNNILELRRMWDTFYSFWASLGIEM